MTLEEFLTLNIYTKNPIYWTYDGEFVPLTKENLKFHENETIKDIRIIDNKIIINLFYKRNSLKNKDNDYSNIKIVKGDITHYDGEAIVNAANTSLSYGGGVCGCIFKKAGVEKLQKECRSKGHQKVGSATLTKGYDLKAKYIIHAVGPIFNENNIKESEYLLSEAYKNTFKICKDNNINYIAFPSISTGVFDYPVEEASLIALKEIINASKYMREIVIYCFNDRTYNAYLKSFKLLTENQK